MWNVHSRIFLASSRFWYSRILEASSNSGLEHTFFFGLGLWSAGLGQRRCLSFCLFLCCVYQNSYASTAVKEKGSSTVYVTAAKKAAQLPAVSLWNSRNLYTNTCRKKGIVIVLTRRIGPTFEEVCRQVNCPKPAVRKIHLAELVFYGYISSRLTMPSYYNQSFMLGLLYSLLYSVGKV